MPRELVRRLSSDQRLIYFWDYQMMMPVLLAPSSQRDLERLVEMRSTRSHATVELTEYHVRQGELGLFALSTGRCKHSTKRLSWVSSDF